METRTEILRFEPIGEFVLIQAAVDGHLSIPFWEHRARFSGLSDAEVRCCIAELAADALKMYGDARHQAQRVH